MSKKVCLLFVGFGVFRAYDSLKRVCHLASGLQHPERIYGTTCRMLFCTVIQVQLLHIPVLLETCRLR